MSEGANNRHRTFALAATTVSETALTLSAPWTRATDAIKRRPSSIAWNGSIAKQRIARYPQRTSPNGTQPPSHATDGLRTLWYQRTAAHPTSIAFSSLSSDHSDLPCLTERNVAYRSYTNRRVLVQRELRFVVGSAPLLLDLIWMLLRPQSKRPIRHPVLDPGTPSLRLARPTRYRAIFHEEPSVLFDRARLRTDA